MVKFPTFRQAPVWSGWYQGSSLETEIYGIQKLLRLLDGNIVNM